MVHGACVNTSWHKDRILATRKRINSTIRKKRSRCLSAKERADLQRQFVKRTWTLTELLLIIVQAHDGGDCTRGRPLHPSPHHRRLRWEPYDRPPAPLPPLRIPDPRRRCLGGPPRPQSRPPATNLPLKSDAQSAPQHWGQPDVDSTQPQLSPAFISFLKTPCGALPVPLNADHVAAPRDEFPDPHLPGGSVGGLRAPPLAEPVAVAPPSQPGRGGTLCAVGERSREHPPAPRPGQLPGACSHL